MTILDLNLSTLAFLMQLSTPVWFDQVAFGQSGSCYITCIVLKMAFLDHQSVAHVSGSSIVYMVNIMYKYAPEHDVTFEAHQVLKLLSYLSKVDFIALY